MADEKSSSESKDSIRDINLNKALELLSSGRYEEALTHLDKIVKYVPNIAALNIKAAALLKHGDLQGAMAIIDKALELNPNNFIILNNKGVLLLQNGKFDEAIKCFDKVIDINPSISGVWNSKGLASLEYKDIDIKINVMNRWVSAKKGWKDVALSSIASWDMENMKLIRHEHFDEAMACFDMSININPLNDQAWSNKGMLLFKEGNYEGALECLARSHEANPKNETVWYNKGLVLRAFGQFHEQVEALNRVLKLNPGHKNALLDKGWALYKLGEFREALRCMNEVLEDDPYNEIAGKVKEECEKKLAGLKDDAAEGEYEESAALNAPAPKKHRRTYECSYCRETFEAKERARFCPYCSKEL